MIQSISASQKTGNINIAFSQILHMFSQFSTFLFVSLYDSTGTQRFLTFWTRGTQTASLAAASSLILAVRMTRLELVGWQRLVPPGMRREERSGGLEPNMTSSKVEGSSSTARS